MFQCVYGVVLVEVDGQVVIVCMVLNNDGSGMDKFYVLEGFESVLVVWRDVMVEVFDQEQVGVMFVMGFVFMMIVVDVVL